MPKNTEIPIIDPLFNKPDDYISGIVRMDPKKLGNLKTYTRKNESRTKTPRRGLRAAIAVTAIGAGVLLANNINNSINDSDKQAQISYEEDILLNSNKTILKGSVAFNPGVNIRRYPSVVHPNEENEGNLAFTVAEGQKLTIENPVIVEVSPEESWVEFTLNKGGPEGKDPITLWVNNDVLNQVNNDGVPYAQLGVEGLYDSGLGEKVSIDSFGAMSVENSPVSIGHLDV